MANDGLARLPDLIATADWAGAEKVLRRAASAKDAPAAVLYNLAKVLVEQGKPEQATTWFRKALARDPSHQAAWFELGRVSVDAQDLQTAERAVAKAAARDPADRDALRNWGRTALRLGLWDRAAEAWGGLPEDDREAAIARFRLRAEAGGSALADAQALIAAHRTPEALSALTRTGRGHLPFRLLPDQR